MIGSIFLSIAFAMALLSCVSYALAQRGGDRTTYLRTARMGFHGAVVAFMLTCATLM